MQDITVGAGWKRFTERLKSMVVPGEKRKLPGAKTETAQGKDSLPLDRLENEGGRSGNRRDT